MRSMFLRLATFLLTFSIGVSTSLLFRANLPSNRDSSIVNNTSAPRLACGGSIVITIPADDEFYLGKERVSLSEIPDKLRSRLVNVTPDERVVYIKGNEGVKYETVIFVIEKIKEAGVEQIGIVSNKKKTSAR